MKHENETVQPAPMGQVDMELGAVAEARNPTAVLNWSLRVPCPKCGQSNDIASIRHDRENDIARRIFTNEWGTLAGWEVTCELCEHEFRLAGVEY